MNEYDDDDACFNKEPKDRSYILYRIYEYNNDIFMNI